MMSLHPFHQPMTYEEAWELGASGPGGGNGAYDSHFRWPSPSLPPTLKKNRRPEQQNRRRDSSTHVTSDAPSSEITAESTAGAATSSGSGSDKNVGGNGNKRTEEGHPPKTFFSRQHVINTCEKKKARKPSTSTSSTSDSSSASMASSASSPSSTSSTTSEEDEEGIVSEMEIDEFGDVVPPHLRKGHKKRQAKNKRKSQVYNLQLEAAKHSATAASGMTKKKSGILAMDEDGWTTDF